MRARRLVTLVLLVSCAGAVAVAEDPPAPAVKEARRVLDALADLQQRTEKKDAVAAARALRDPSWVVRRFAAIRLDVLGLDEKTAHELRDGSAPGTKPLAETSAALQAADKHAATVELDKEASPEKPSVLDAARTFASLLTEEAQRGRCATADRRALVSSLEVYAAASGSAEARRFLARRVLALADKEAILKDLGAKDDDEASRDDGAKLLEWWRANERFSYFARRQGRFRLDREARAAGVPTDEFRQKTPWPEGQGPEAAGGGGR